MLLKIRQILGDIANWVVALAGGTILFVLTWYSFRFTEYMLPNTGYEENLVRRDSMLINLLFAGIVLAVLYFGKEVERRLSEKWQRRLERIVLGISMLWQGIWGVLWVLCADRPPNGDQLRVYQAAMLFVQGDYQALGRGGYCETYPYQLGLASLEELIFRVIGKPDYHVIQLLMVGMTVLSVFCVYGILKEWSEHMTVVVLGTLLTASCSSMIFYTSWMYGDLPFVALSLLTLRCAVRYVKYGKIRSLAGAVLAMTGAVFLRSNAWILVVAFCLVTGVNLLKKWDRKLLAAAICAVLLPTLIFGGLYRIYEERSGYPHKEGLPTNGFIYIGLMESEGRYGWDYTGSDEAYRACGRDTKRAEEAFSVLIRERMQEMRSIPGYLPAFYKGKILSQWNSPMYQGMFFNYLHEDVHMEEAAAFFDRCRDDWYEGFLWQADRLQFVIYLGTFLYFALCIRRKKEMLNHVAAVTVIGGFLFSILWEAKTRYVFPYYMMMFPLAMFGYEQFLTRVGLYFKLEKGIMHRCK